MFELIDLPINNGIIVVLVLVNYPCQIPYLLSYDEKAVSPFNFLITSLGAASNDSRGIIGDLSIYPQPDIVVSMPMIV